MLLPKGAMVQRLKISHASRQQQRDDWMWVRKDKHARLYGLSKIWCPCGQCKGGKMCKLAIVKDHLIQYGRGPREWDSLDDEWEEAFRNPRR